jgi:hypothetical protein
MFQLGNKFTTLFSVLGSADEGDGGDGGGGVVNSNSVTVQYIRGKGYVKDIYTVIRFLGGYRVQQGLLQLATIYFQGWIILSLFFFVPDTRKVEHR